MWREFLKSERFAWMLTGLGIWWSVMGFPVNLMSIICGFGILVWSFQRPHPDEQAGG